MHRISSLTKMTTTKPEWNSKILKAQTALLNHTAGSLTHTPLTLPHANGSINAIETLNPYATCATTLFLLHGWGAGLAMYYRALPHLPFRTIYTLDLPGMGGSSREPFPATHEPAVRYFVDALDAAFHHLSARASCAPRRVLAAHSLGGFVAAEWQLRRRRFDGLLLVSPVGIPHPPAARGTPRLAWRLAQSLWRGGVTPQGFVRVFGRRPVCTFVNARFDLPDARGLVAEYLYQISVARPAAERALNVLLAPGAWARVPLAGRLPAVDTPVGFLYGETDWMDWTAAEKVRAELEWSWMERVRGAGHHVFVDSPREFAAAVERVVFEMEKVLEQDSILGR